MPKEFDQQDNIPMDKHEKNVSQHTSAPHSQAEIVTFGCRLNIHESEVIKEQSAQAELEDAIIFNTCAVTKQAEAQARQAIRRKKRENPNAKIIVTGCSAQINAGQYSAMEEVDKVIGNELKLEASTWEKLSLEKKSDLEHTNHASNASNASNVDAKNKEKENVSDIMQAHQTFSHTLADYEARARAIVQVQNGCDHRCTFCIIPYGRGNSRSMPVSDITRQVQGFVEAGYQEVVLSGVDITSYGPDLEGKPSLGAMIKDVMKAVPELKRLRLSSLDPAEIDKDLWALIEQEERFMPYLHLSVQSGDNMILKRMKRRHSREDVFALVKRARKARPDMSFGADIIAGFPTETEEMFLHTHDLLEQCNISFLHVFPYSERDGTPAARMPQVDNYKRTERAKMLRELGHRQHLKLLQKNLGKTLNVVVEKGGFGRADNFIKVKLDQDYPVGSLITLQTIAIENDTLLGQSLA